MRPPLLHMRAEGTRTHTGCWREKGRRTRTGVPGIGEDDVGSWSATGVEGGLAARIAGEGTMEAAVRRLQEF